MVILGIFLLGNFFSMKSTFLYLKPKITPFAYKITQPFECIGKLGCLMKALSNVLKSCFGLLAAGIRTWAADPKGAG